DAKSHRAERRLEVRHVHFEPWFATGGVTPTGPERLDQDQALAGVASALRSLAVFVGGEAMLLRPVTPRRLPPPLARRLHAAGVRPTSGPSPREPGAASPGRRAAATRSRPRVDAPPRPRAFPPRTPTTAGHRAPAEPGRASPPRSPPWHRCRASARGEFRRSADRGSRRRLHR